MTTKVCPFLISRNRYLDYRTVVAPDFICDAKISNLLARVAEGELTEKGKGFIRNVIRSKVGDFTIVFRVIKATEKDIDITKGSNILKDQFGREIYIFEGIVAQGIIENFAISDSDFQKIHQRLTTNYEEFWGLTEPTPAVPSQAFILDMENVTNPIILEKLELFDLTPKPSKPVKQTNISTNGNIQPNKLSGKFWLILILTAVIVSFFGKVLLGNPILLGCAITLEEKIEFQPGANNISDQLKEQKKEYSENASIYLSGSLKIESTNNIKNKEFSGKSKKQPTIKLSKDNRLVMEYHPIDLAISDMKNQKVNENSEITLRLIDRSECT